MPVSSGLYRLLARLCRLGRSHRELPATAGDESSGEEELDVHGHQVAASRAVLEEPRLVALPTRVLSPRSLEPQAGSSVAADSIAAPSQLSTPCRRGQFEVAVETAPSPSLVGAGCEDPPGPEAAQSGTPVLHLAAQYPSAGPVRALLKANADVHEKDDNGVTALHIAALCARAEAAEILLQAGALTSTVAVDGSVPLHVAARSGSMEVIRLLLQAKSDVNAKDAVGGTALHCAAGAAHAAACEVLLDRGADCHAADAWKRSPLHAAAYGGSAGAVKALLLQGANPDAKDVLGDVPLDLANQHGHANASMLLSKTMPLVRKLSTTQNSAAACQAASLCAPKDIITAAVANVVGLADDESDETGSSGDEIDGSEVESGL
eukprot:TRINITY_DN81080_c0_g1_i1.p1 TRINITY_DN81080_c0_g1~~TRINITY_DN81080_c0_g1_i1.p1  ORF type:complete len:378 (-),score=63.47 TRINITY_DN81080_c0_g1_i1:138-1271(-)